MGSDTPREVGGAIQGKVATEISCGAEFSIVILEDGKVSSHSPMSKYFIFLVVCVIET